MPNPNVSCCVLLPRHILNPDCYVLSIGLDICVPIAQSCRQLRNRCRCILDTNLRLEGRRTLGGDQHSNLAILEPNRCCHCRFQVPCRCGFIHRSNYPCKGPIHLVHIVLVLRGILPIRLHTCCPNHRSHNRECCRRNWSA